MKSLRRLRTRQINRKKNKLKFLQMRLLNLKLPQKQLKSRKGKLIDNNLSSRKPVNPKKRKSQFSRAKFSLGYPSRQPSKLLRL